MSPDTPGILFPGEYVIYNCSDPIKNVTEWGAFYALQCVNGQINAPTAWPLCREPMA
jgi:hypothetical protein